MLSLISILVLFIPFSSSFLQGVNNSHIVFENVARYIDLSNQIVNIRNVITVQNEYDIPVNKILYTTEELRTNLAYFEARTGNTKERITFVEHKNSFYWTLILNKFLAPGKSTTIEIIERWTNLLEHYPKKIKSATQEQFVRYRGNVYLSSPYKIKEITTQIDMGISKIENFTRIPPTAFSASIIIYGPYFDINVHSLKKFELHYKKIEPFVVVTNYERVIKVSHLGPIYIEETIELLHAGSQYTGPFYTNDFQNKEIIVPNIKRYAIVVPSLATHISYRDDIGKIYTYKVQHFNDFDVVELELRYPLRGGWKIKFTVSYFVPNYECLFRNKNGDYVLKVTMLDHITHGIIVNKLTTKIILPEKVQNIKMEAPFEIYRLPDSQYRTILDTSGRKVIILSKENLISDYKLDVMLLYQYSALHLLNKPIIFSLIIFGMFIIIIVNFRLDLTINKRELPKIINRKSKSKR